MGRLVFDMQTNPYRVRPLLSALILPESGIQATKDHSSTLNPIQIRQTSQS
jgi:hypothetical protein